MDRSQRIDKTKSVWIYGIGKIGKKAYSMLTLSECEIRGIVVTNTPEQPQFFDGIRILGIDEADIAEEDEILIAVFGALQDEIAKELKKRGHKNYIRWSDECIRQIWLSQKFSFTDRSRKTEKVCFVLIGYKEFLWKAVFERLRKFVPEDVEICLCSSGIYIEKLEEIAKKNRWSYLSTEVNSVSLIQNIALSLFDRCQWIYKMDEDMFLTEGVFDNLYEAYNRAEKESIYHVGFIAPLIPVNGYGYRRILQFYNCVEDYESRFEKAYLGGDPESEIEKNPEAAIYMWGSDRLPRIDRMARDIRENNTYSICNVRFSIGFILFNRVLWENMGGFSVSGNKDLGADEEEICGWCINHSKAIVVADNAIVGHFSFGKQTEEMKKYYVEHSERFDLEVGIE